MPDARGFTLIDLVATLAVGVPLAATALVALDPQSGVPAGSKQAKDGEQLQQIYKSLTIFAQGERGKRFMTPGSINRKPVVMPDGTTENVPGMGETDEAKNSHANLWSAMLALEYFPPQLLVSPLERSPKVVAVKDYNYRAYDPRQDRYWDGDGPEGDGDVPSTRRVTADLAVKSCTSYAAMPLDDTPRRKAEWKISGNPKFAVLGNRGPFDGSLAAGIPGSSPPQTNDASQSMLLHGEPGRWAGFVVLGDGSSRYVRGFTPTFMAPVKKGDGTEPENLFREDGEPRQQADVFLAIVKRCMVADGPKGKVTPELSWD